MRLRKRTRPKAADWSSGTHQLQALLWKQYLLKKRSWFLTVMELLSPILIVSILVLAYLIADPQFWPPRVRVLDTDMTLNDLYSGAEDWAAANLPLDCQRLLQNQTLHANFTDAELDAQIHMQLPEEGLAADESGIANRAARNALLQNCTTSVQLGSPEAGNLAADLLKHLFDRNGPLPVPTLDEYILIHELLQTSAHGSSTLMSLLRRLQFTLGPHAFGNLVDLGKIAFAPDTPEVRVFARHLLESHHLFGKYYEGIFESEQQAEAFTDTADERLWALVVFHNGPNESGADYTIRMDFTAIPDATLKVDTHNHGVPGNAKQYLTSGFLSIQNAIEAYSLGLSAEDESSLGPLSLSREDGKATMFTVWTSVFPQAAYLYHNFYTASGALLGILMSVSIIFPISQLVRGFVEEREDGSVDLMYVMGLKPWVATTSWAITYSVIFSAVSFGLAVLCHASFFNATSFSLLLVLILIFSISEVAFSLMVGTFFEHATVAAIIAPLLHCLAVVPRYIFFRTEDGQSLTGKYVACLLSPSAFSFASDSLMLYQGGGQGLTWGHLWADDLPLGAIMLIMLGNTFLYSLVTAYATILLSQNGMDLPVYFPILPSFWRTTLKRRTPSGKAKAEEEQDEETGILPPATDIAVQVTGLSKDFGSKPAVKDVSMNLHVGQLKSLLGHNGAGKSTLVGMMTGLVAPTGGSCLISGKSIIHQPSHARQHLGFCPQRNVLYGRLTVYEHCLLYSGVKGVKGGAFSKQAHSAALAALEALGMSEKIDAEVSALSGGMKRKLQVALAMLGNSTVLILDEPTSGLDPGSRHAFWEILLKLRPNHAILLITQFTEEANLLSDEVAILLGGKIISSGSPQAICQKYCPGLQLSIHLDTNGNTIADSSAILQTIHSHVSSAVVRGHAASELCISLPDSDCGQLVPLITALEEGRQELGIATLGLRTPSLEEAFIQASLEGASLHASELSQQALPQETLKQEQHCAVKSDEKQHGGRFPAVASTTPLQGRNDLGSSSHAGRCFMEMLKKRAIISRRDSRSILWAYLMPLVGIFLVTAFLALAVDPASVDMQIDITGNQQTGPISVLGLPDSMSPCSGSALVSDASSCQDGLAFVDRYHSFSVLGQRDSWLKSGQNRSWLRNGQNDTWWKRNDSVAMSHILLEDLANKQPLQDVALVFDDLIIKDLMEHKVVDSLFKFGGFLKLLSAAPIQRASAILDTMLHKKTSAQLADLDQKAANASLSLSDLEGLAENNTDKLANPISAELLGSAESFMHSSAHLKVLENLRKRVSSGTHTVNLMYNASVYHLLPAALSGFHEVLGILNSPAEVRPRFQASSRPLPLSEKEILEKDRTLLLLVAIFTLIPFCLLTGAFCINLVAERGTGFHDIQLLSGCPAIIYWLGSFVWDFGSHMCLCVAAMVLFALLGNKVVTASLQQAFASFLVLVAYGAAAIPLTYCMCLKSTSVPTAQVCISAFAFVTGACAIIASKVLERIPEAAIMLGLTRPLLRLLPSFSLAEALVQLTEFHYKSAIFAADLKGGPRQSAVASEVGSLFDWDVCARPLAYLFLTSVGYSILLLTLTRSRGLGGLHAWASWLTGIPQMARGSLRLKSWLKMRRPATGMQKLAAEDITSEDNVELIETSWAGSSLPAPQKAGSRGWDLEVVLDGDEECKLPLAEQGPDEGMLEEVRRCEAEPAAHDSVRLQHLTKVYDSQPPKVALQDVCLGVRPGERLGLLGVNGAGKSTMMGILTGRLQSFSGDAFVGGSSVLHGRSPPSSLGYCPQQDPLNNHLTAEEHLSLVAVLKGVPYAEVATAVEEAVEDVLLSEALSRCPAGHYSGGSKRKLSLAMALMGDVQCLLLDEPTTGMDPMARQAMWKLVTHATEASKSKALTREQHPTLRDSRPMSTLLTTHSLEEAEVLCQHVAVLQQRILCVGKPSELRAKYCPCLVLSLELAESQMCLASHLESLLEFVKNSLEGELIRRRGPRFEVAVNNADTSLSHVLKTLEASKSQFGIRAYEVSQPKMEQVYLAILRHRG